MIENVKYLFLFFTLTIISCVNLKPLDVHQTKKVTGIILEGESGEVMIGQQVSEFDNLLNNTITDINGKFEILFERKIPVLVLHGFYEQLYVEITTEKRNQIYIDKKLFNCSKKTLRSVKRLLKAEN